MVHARGAARRSDAPPWQVPLVIEIQSARGLRAAVPQLFEQTVVEPPLDVHAAPERRRYCICEVFGRDDATAPSFRTRPRPDEDAPRWDERQEGKEGSK